LGNYNKGDPAAQLLLKRSKAQNNKLYKILNQTKRKATKTTLGQGSHPAFNARLTVPTKSIHLTFKAKEEAVLPIKKGGCQVPEDFPISLFPYFLECDGEDFHEETEVKVHSSLLHSVKEVEAMIP
jgi:hypothetical protein